MFLLIDTRTIAFYKKFLLVQHFCLTIIHTHKTTFLACHRHPPSFGFPLDMHMTISPKVPRASEGGQSLPGHKLSPLVLLSHVMRDPPSGGS